MGNNMELDYEMFCYQCELPQPERLHQAQCVRKTPEVANLQDLFNLLDQRASAAMPGL